MASFSSVFLLVLCVPIIAGFLADSVSTQECLQSYNTSQEFSLHPESFENGADLLLAQQVNSSSECLSRCCVLERCNLALVQESDAGEINCLLVDCIRREKSVCTLLSRQGYEANFKPGYAHKSGASTVDCTSPSKTGPCRAAFPKWYYNTTTRTCEEFTYGGCLANLNNYDNEEACLKTCSKVTGPSNNFVPVVSRSVMSLKDCSNQCSPDEFRCDDGCCVPLHLMCDGMAQCLDKSDLPFCIAIRVGYSLLTAYKGPSDQNNEKCTAPKVVGRCRGAFPRWYFDPKTQNCNKFTYGGCKGNQNNYISEQECLDSCAGQKEVIPKSQTLRTADPDDQAYCFVPAVTGKCRASFPRWYYEPASQTCKPFTFGGCGGNKNNYGSENECLARCSGKTGNWDDKDDSNSHEKQHQAEFRHHMSAISMVVLLAICVLILLSGVIYFIIKLAKSDHVVSYHRTHSGEDKETLINTA